MGKLHSRTWTWTFDSPPEALWPVLADTARFNEAAKLSKHKIEEHPRPDGSVLYLGSARQGPFELEWEEIPVNWVTGQWFEHDRRFRRGPLKRVCATMRLHRQAGGCRAEYRLEAEAANWIGEVILRTGFFPSVHRTFDPLFESAREYARGERDQAFDFAPPAPPPGAAERREALVGRIEASGHGHGLAERLAALIARAQEVDLSQIRPLRLARLWQKPARETIELCLESARAGLLELRWDLLCPRCRVAKVVIGSLDQLPEGAHCDTCNIDYERDFAKNVELSFRPAAAIRPISHGEYCLFGPMSTPHILVHVTLAAGESRELEAQVPPGPYRLRTLEPGPELDIEVGGEGLPEVVALSDAMQAGDPAPPGRIKLANGTDRRLTLIVEERAWVAEALTADRVTTLQAFRDLFSDQVLRPGDEVALRHVTLMFTDLRGSTALYGAIGDAQAYHLVRDHFAFLSAIVRGHEGAVIKTIGDAIMAAFSEPGAALEAALRIQQEVSRFNEAYPEHPVTIKLGLHGGACIAVTLNDRLDYFGSTVNLAARLQNESRGGDIVISEALAEDPGVAARLVALDPKREEAALKGFDEPVAFLRIAPNLVR